jgi:hypothetical protein
MAEKKENELLAQFLAGEEAKNAPAQPTEAPRTGRHAVTEIPNSTDFITLLTDALPMGVFYYPGTRIQIRPATTGEIQSYSIVDDSNVYDCTVKMNEILATCTRIVLPDGSYGTYRDIKDGDRLFVVTEIARATASKGQHLVQKANCPSCHEVNVIQLTSKNFVLKSPSDEFMDKYFDENTRLFVFKRKGTKNVLFTLGAPSIGLTTDIYDYAFSRVNRKEKPNAPFMLCAPWMLADRDSLSIQEAEKEETAFTNMQRDVFLALNDAVNNKMQFGIKELKCNCSNCGTEVRAPYDFPGGASSLFVVPDAFDDLIG